MILAQLTARVFNATRGQGQPAVSFSEFLLSQDRWGEPTPGSQLAPEELQMIGYLGKRSRET